MENKEYGKIIPLQTAPKPVCRWFSRCGNLGVKVVDHPVAGKIRVCEPCASKLK